MNRVFVSLLLAFVATWALDGRSTAHAQATPAPASPGAVRERTATDNYVLGPSDVIEVGVLGRADFTTRARIGSDGEIKLPFIGSISAEKMTAQQFSERVSRALEAGGYFSRPIVTVDIVSYASEYVTVLGSVANPGLVPIDRPYRLSEILARVGGVKDLGADYVVLRPAQGPEKRLQINAIATGGDDTDPYVSPGDKIYSPPAQLFFISGQVKAPGAYPLGGDMTLRMAISKAGGVTDVGSDKKVKLTRAGHPLDHMDLDGKIEAGDVVIVGERLF